MNAPHEYTGPEPVNWESKAEELVQSFITEEKNVFRRNHGEIPQLGDEHIVRIDGAVSNPINLTIHELANKFKQATITSALQCAGNRRHTMRTELHEVQGIDWFDGAVMNGVWTGPRIRDVLLKVGLDQKAQEEMGSWHVQFACLGFDCQDDSYYGSSISLARAMDYGKDAILALQLNGKPLLADFGGPVRVLIPGVCGARSVKWVSQITVTDQSSPNFYQTFDYKVLPPEATGENAHLFWDKVPPLMGLPVNSAIALPRNGSTVHRDIDGLIEVKGYAVPGGDNGPITKVEISVDDGNSWQEAQITCPSPSRWCWSLWQARVSPNPGKVTILSRAHDQRDMQDGNSVWNLRGVAYSGYGQAKDIHIVE
ncbi:sulfite oxidase [Eremomyces bilateralis CBS 781.70]|uniref:Sulfite oxidase n=1 Tax=Eremomyces bilateralis CBS 781.70 TaxID=1392243 RepID=A0A6G1GHL3_9PEZI|nr:sulfite oxidase [Eremomyces bilateralis CBS 781.70]KAF1817543.1 sulfite oxidase [Eremomyces bilateralis CBS 781.70]